MVFCLIRDFPLQGISQPGCRVTAELQSNLAVRWHGVVQRETVQRNAPRIQNPSTSEAIELSQSS